MSDIRLVKKDEDKDKLKNIKFGISATGVKKLETEANEAVNTLKKYQEKLDRQEYFSKDDLKGYKSAMDSYIDSSNRLKNLNKSLGKSFTEEEEKTWNDSMSSLQSGYKELNDYFSKYKTEKDYKDAVAAFKQQETMRGEDVEKGMAEVNAILSGKELTALKEEKAKLEKERENAYRSRQRTDVYNPRNNGVITNVTDKRLAELEKEIAEIEKPALERKDYLTQAKYLQNYFYVTENDVSLEELKSHLKDEDPIAYTDVDGTNVTWQKLYDKKKDAEEFDALYNEMSAMPDWEEESKYKPTYDTSKGGRTSFNAGDDDYERANHPVISANGMSDIYYAYYTDEKEKQLFNYLAHTKGTDYAIEWLMSREDIYKERVHELGKANAKKFAEEMPVISDVIAVMGSAIVSPFEYLGNAITGNAGDRIYSADFSSTIKSTRMEQIDWEIGNWDVFDFLYGTGTSMAESALAMTAFGYGGGIALGLSAASQETNSALDRGMSKNQAFWSGLAAGTFECLFETLSIGQFNALKTSFKSGGKAIALNIAKSMLVNASEETLTEIANIVYDNIVNADFSNYETMVRTYVMQGMSVEKAQAQAKSDLKWQVAEAAASGAFMGLGFGSYGSVKAHRNARAVESSYDDGDINTIISEGLAVPGSEAYELAQKAQAKLSEGKKLTAQEILDLQKATTKAFTESDMSKMKEAAALRLAELGETGNSSALAKIIAKQAAGQKLTVSEKSLLKNSKYGQRVANEMSPENIASGNYASAWAEDIGTDLVNRDAYNGLYKIAQEMASPTEAVKTESAQKVTPQFTPYSSEYIENLDKEYEAMGIPTEQAKSLAVSQVARPSETNSSPTTENAVETEFEVSKDGETFDTKSGKAINIKKIDSISEGGVANLKLDNGMIIKASDVSFGTEAEAIIVEQIGKIKLGKKGISTSAANALYQRAIIELKNNPNMTANEAMKLVQGLKESFYYGAYNFGSEKLTTTDKAGRSIFYAGELNESQRNWAYKLGKQERANETNAKQKALDDQKAKVKVSKKGMGKIVFEDGINVDESALTKTQKVNLEGIKLLSEVSSIEFHIFKSTKVGNTFKYTMPNGTVVSANGWYVSGTNEIWVDLNAGNAGQGTMLRTAAHEISHYIKQWSPKKWQAMADLLMESFAKNGVDTESMLSRQIDKIKRRYTKKNMPSPAKLLDMAHEEFVSDALTDMLTDGSVVNFMAEVKAQDKSLWQKIRDAIKNLLNKWGLIVEDYKGRSLDAAEAQALSQLEDTFGQLQQMYQEAFVDANEAVEAAEKGMFVDEISEQFEMRDSEGNELSQEQQKFFAESKITDENGNLLRLYHGTKNGGFTKFIPKFSDDGISLFLTPSRELANTYTDSNETVQLPEGKKGLARMFETGTGKGKGQSGIYEVFANLKNPYVMECNGANWDALPFNENIKGKTRVDAENRFDPENNILYTKVTIDGKVHEKTFDLNHLVEAANAELEELAARADIDKELHFNIFLSEQAKPELLEYYRTLSNEKTAKHLWHETDNAITFADDITYTFNGLIDNETGRVSRLNTRFVSKWAKENGYDGVWFKNITDIGGTSEFQGENAIRDVIVAYDSSQIKSVDNLNPTKNKDIRYSERDFSEQVDAVLNGEDTTSTHLRIAEHTPKILMDIGLSDKPLLITSAHTKTALGYNVNGKNIHNISKDVFVRLPQLIEKPVIVMESINKGSIVMFVNAVDVDNNPVLCAIKIDGKGFYNNVELESNIVTSVYGKDTNPVGFIEKAVDENRLLYWDKKMSQELFDIPGLQLSDNINNFDSNVIIRKLNQEVKENDVKHSDRDNSTSNRSILANALEGAAQNDIERNKLAQYKDKIAKIEAEEKRLGEIQKQLFTKGAVDSAQRKDLQFEAKQIANRINTYDRQLLNLESTTALKNVLNREKALAAKRQKQKDNEALKQYKEKVAKTTKELMTRHQESRKKAIESREKTAVRHKIKSVVGDLNNLLLKPTKERHVPQEMQLAVAEALNLINMDTVGADERVAKYNELIAKAKDPDVIASLTETRDRILKQGNKMSEKLGKLKSAYEQIRDSADDSVSSIYDDVIYNRIARVQEKVGDTALRNMSLEQLEEVHDLYKMVLTTVRDSNKAFAENIKESRLALGSNTFAEIKENNKTRDRIRFEGLERFGWQYLKPMQAIKTIGSGTLSKLWNNILYGQETFARDYDEAVKFAKEMKEKHGYKKWDLTKTYSFESKSGKAMKINLEQMMSIYAYSKRKQADEHIEYGGIVLNEGIIKEKNKLGKTVEYKVNDSTAYRLDKMQVGEIISTMEKEFPGAKNFVDDMQKYLSETMGAKGNEVAMKMYGIELFKEDHYFPLKSSKEFMEAANQKLKGDVKIKNKGMTKSVVEHARNPIVLEGFLDVWGNHVNEMSMYHGLVLPLEDFSRTLNYGFKADDSLNYDAESVRTALHDAFGENADNYLNELLKAINGGVLRDSSAEFADRMISKFKKAKVMASLSVIVQQPTAIIRAMNYIEPKYFIHQSINHKQTWEELKKYCPTAIIKETGSFDTNMGKTIVGMIKEDDKFTEKVGDVLGKAPAYMDEVGWNSIWRALKTKVAKEQKLTGEELLKECGKQMTLIINETQVYDSVMSRNELMRSKSVFNKMATAFMAEPTTVVNMIYGAALDFKRGKKGMASKTVAATIGSVVINSLVSSLVYALRDDDEEETFLEKYISSATTEVLDGLNPLTYIPYVKDAYSIIQGYKVERVDMTLIKDVVDAVNTFYDVLDPEKYEDMEQGEIASYIWGNAKPLLTSICDMFGLPVGNILRDAEAIIVNDSLDMSKTNSTGTGYAFKEGAMSSLPTFVQKLIGNDTKSDKLYDAIVSNDTEYLKRLKDTYKDEEAYKTAARKALGANENLYDSIVNGDTDSIKRWKSAYPEKKDYESLVKKALRENDPRIREAAELRRSGQSMRCFEIVDEIASEGHFSRTLVISAVNAELEKIKREEKENKQ